MLLTFKTFYRWMFQSFPKCFQTIWKQKDCLQTSKLFEYFSDFSHICKLSRHFPNCPENLNCQESLKTVLKLHILSGCFQSCLKRNLILWKLSRLPKKVSRLDKNIAMFVKTKVGPQLQACNLSKSLWITKTFRVAMLPHYWPISVSGTYNISLHRLYCTILYSTVLYSTVQYSTVEYSTVR